jgi:prepilin-type processing-associated H-X9-DG protein
MGWYLYAEDNDAYIMDGDTGDTADGWRMTNGKLVHLFTPDPQDVNGNRRNSSLEDKIRGYQKGAMWPYMETHKLFNCRSDKRWRKDAINPYLSGKCIGGYRSYSMGAPLSRMGIGATDTRENLCFVEKKNEFVNPSSKVVWLEEADGYGINHRTWNMYLGHKQWWDPFAIWHNGSSTFGYADGHAERHKWVEELTIRMAENQSKTGGGGGERVPANESRDYDWFRSKYIPGKIPAALR